MSQSEMILEYLESGKKLTSLEALDKFGCFRLASRIHDLKKRGYKILSEDIEKNNKRYSVYWIEREKEFENDCECGGFIEWKSGLNCDIGYCLRCHKKSYKILKKVG